MTISLASVRDVYSTEDVFLAFNKLDEKSDRAQSRLYTKMIERGGERFAVKPSRVPDAQSLYEDLPNFKAVVDSVVQQVALCVDTKDDLEVAPILLVGPPGVGKTRFAKQLAALLCTGFNFIPMNSVTAGWILSGSAATWQGAKPGKVFDALVSGQFANPVVVLDEIDKATGSSQYDPLGALYTLLERETSRAFVDEFAEVPVDAGGIVWVATANDPRSIPDPILSRMMVFEIPAPTHEEAMGICLAIYQGMRKAHEWGERFPQEPSEGVLSQMARVSPREVNQVLVTAFGRAKLEGRFVLEPKDFPDAVEKRRPMGFTAA